MSPDARLETSADPSILFPDLAAVRWRIESVTPQMAKDWLLTRVSRLHRLSPSLLNAYARDLKTDCWRLNGSPLIFSRDGKLLDGQLRLHACVTAQRPFRTLIVEGIDPEAALTIDEVRGRSLSSVLSIRREQHGSCLGTALGLLYQYYFNQRDVGRHRPSVQELLHVLEQRPELRNQIATVHSRRNILAPSVACVVYHLGCRVDPVLTHRFFEELADDSEVSPQRPAACLRHALANRDRQLTGPPRTWMMAVAIKAWNAARRADAVTDLSWRQPDPHEPFPQLDGLPPDDGQGLIGFTSLGAEAASGAGDILVAAELLTPDAARRMLADNTSNRPMNRVTIERYKRAMLSGQWILNGQTIKIGQGGRLLDGQHRCQAVAESNCSIPVLLVTEVQDEDFSTLDLGRSRQFADVLKNCGELSACSMAGGVRLIYKQHHGPQVPPPNNRDLYEFYLRYRDRLQLSHRFASQTAKILEASIGTCLHFAFSNENPSKANEFFGRLADGAGLDKGNPILLLRNRLVESRLTLYARVTPAYRISLAVSAWRAFLENRTLAMLKGRDAHTEFTGITWIPDP